MFVQQFVKLQTLNHSQVIQYEASGPGSQSALKQQCRINVCISIEMVGIRNNDPERFWLPPR